MHMTFDNRLYEISYYMYVGQNPQPTEIEKSGNLFPNIEIGDLTNFDGSTLTTYSNKVIKTYVLLGNQNHDILSILYH